MADAQAGLDAVRELLAIKRESNDLEVQRCVCLLSNNSLQKRSLELADEMLDGDMVQIATERAAIQDQIAENIRTAAEIEKKLTALMWRLHQMEDAA